MSDRVHDFSDVNPRVAHHLEIKRAMARCLAGSDDTSVEERYARAADEQVGSSDQFAGCAYTYLLTVSTDEREVIERELMAADLMREALRTCH